MITNLSLLKSANKPAKQNSQITIEDVKKIATYSNLHNKFLLEMENILARINTNETKKEEIRNQLLTCLNYLYLAVDKKQLAEEYPQAGEKKEKLEKESSGFTLKLHGANGTLPLSIIELLQRYESELFDLPFVKTEPESYLDEELASKKAGKLKKILEKKIEEICGNIEVINANFDNISNPSEQMKTQKQTLIKNLENRKNILRGIIAEMSGIANKLKEGGKKITKKDLEEALDTWYKQTGDILNLKWNPYWLNTQPMYQKEDITSMATGQNTALINQRKKNNNDQNKSDVAKGVLELYNKISQTLEEIKRS